jgi:hydrophobic/amphiphilic exporter-1 (mainly G- bacteria), HAE1 family
MIDSARSRMLPILITALATIVGLLAIALTSEVSAPLTRAAIGGLTVCMALALLLVPCTYELLYSRSINEEV